MCGASVTQWRGERGEEERRTMEFSAEAVREVLSDIEFDPPTRAVEARRGRYPIDKFDVIVRYEGAVFGYHLKQDNVVYRDEGLQQGTFHGLYERLAELMEGIPWVSNYREVEEAEAVLG